MATTGTGVVLSSGSALLIYDSGGGVVASVAKPQPAGMLSSPVVGPDGSIYFADSATVQRVDGTGRQVWQKSLGGNIGGNELARPGSPAIDANGLLFLPALDGKLWILRTADGEVLTSPTLGLRSGAARSIGMGIGKILFIDRTGIAAAGPGIGAQGLLATDSGSWVGEVVVGNGASPAYTIAGYEIGVVASGYQDTTSEVLDTFVTDRCGNLRWRVPGSYAVPLRITFDDDLIVMDRTPIGGGKYDFALRRFSKDGAVRAGPVRVTDQACGSFFVGADDTFYYTGGASDGYRLRAFDASLNEIWVTPFPHCPDAAVLSADGKIFTARAAGAQFAAVQTTSPGPAPVSWGQVARDARATRWLAP